LQKLINQRGVFSDTQAKQIINQIFRAQYDFSLQKVIHRDLKPANIGIHINTLTNDVLQDDSALADFIKTFDFATNLDKYCIKFFDLGFSETVDENGFGSASKSGTPAYSSPEQLRGGFQTPNSDAWAIGVIYYQLLTGNLPYLGRTRE
jgi:serine/threonine-protein kinase